jgi:hypothetical protein
MHLEKTEGNESAVESPEIKMRKEAIARIEGLSPEEFEALSTTAQLSDTEKASMTHMRDTGEWLARHYKSQDVRDLYFAAKHPTLSRTFQKLNIAVDNPHDSEQLAKLDEREAGFTKYDFEQALEKIKSHLN